MKEAISTTSRKREHDLPLLDEHFTLWWAGFLLSVSATLKQFRAFGDDDGQLVALALAARALRSGRASSLSLAGQSAHDGLSLSEIAVMTGCPLETTRRTLKRMRAASSVLREGNRYSILVGDELLAAGATQAEVLAQLLSAIPAREFPGWAPGNEEHTKELAAAICWTAALRYCANLRRRITKGAYLGCMIAGMIQVESQVRRMLLASGKHGASREAFNNVAVTMPEPLISTQETGRIAGEPSSRVHAAVQHAVDLGLGTVPMRGLFRYSIGAAAVSDDSQAYTRGVKEALVELCSAFPRPTAI